MPVTTIWGPLGQGEKGIGQAKGRVSAVSVYAAFLVKDPVISSKERASGPKSFVEMPTALAEGENGEVTTCSKDVSLQESQVAEGVKVTSSSAQTAGSTGRKVWPTPSQEEDGGVSAAVTAFIGTAFF